MPRDDFDALYSARERQKILFDYLLENTSEGHVVPTQQILSYLAEQYDIVNSDIKTLYNDLEMLRQSYGVEITYDFRLHGYWMRNPHFDPVEVRLLVESVQASRFITKAKARDLCGKLKAMTDRYTRSSLTGDTVNDDRIRSMNDSIINQVEAIHQAIRENRQISFRYYHYLPDRRNTKKYSRKGEQVFVSPFRLEWNDGFYYLYAYNGKKLTYYRVDRMENVLVQKWGREGKDLLTAQEKQVKKVKVFRSYSTKKVYDVSLRFVNHLAGAVIDEFGNDVWMTAIDEDHFSITVPVDVSPPFYAWVASFGHKVKILGPREVQEGMAKFLQDAQDMLKDEGNI